MRSNDSQKILVVGLPKTLNDAQLSDLFSEFGAVAEAKVVIDAASSISRGFGFVTFTAASAMRAAIKSMDKKEIQGRTLNVRQLVPKDEFQSQKKDVPDASQRPCWLLRKGKCTKGANCVFSHDIKDGHFGHCFEFRQTGACKRGNTCKFLHPVQEPVEDGVEPELLVVKPVDKRVCYSFQNGRCHRGKQCMFAHELLLNGETKDVKLTQEHNTTEVGVKRRRIEEVEQEVKDVPIKEHTARIEGLAGPKNTSMAPQTQLRTTPTTQTATFQKFEWKAKGLGEVQQVQQQEKKIKTEKIDMGAAFDGISDDERDSSRIGKSKVNKETMRANRVKIKHDRRLKRTAKLTALAKLLTKTEVEL